MRGLRINPVWAVAPVLLLAAFVGFALVDSEEADGATTCATCEGTGKVKCSNCGGQGVYTDSAGTVYGCASCGGSGYISDAYYNFKKGTGKVACSDCNGIGAVADDPDAATNCTTCKGTGRVICSACQGNGYQYNSVSGKTFGCTSCGGSGYTQGTVASDYKEGTGRVACSACNGTGTIYTHTATLQYAVGTELLPGFTQTESTTGTSSTASGSATFTIQSGYPTITGYTFLGWSLSEDATTAEYQPEGSITVPYGSTVTLYAVLQAAQLTIDSEPPKTAKIGQEWTYAPFTDVGVYTLAVSGADWLNVTADGMAVYGTPAAAGSYDVTITMSKDGYADAVQPFTLTVYSALAFAHVPSSAGVFVHAG